MIDRRGFFGGVIRSAIAGALLSCVRWLPMPAAPRLPDVQATLTMILREYYLPAVKEWLNSGSSLSRIMRLCSEERRVREAHDAFYSTRL